MRTYLIAEKADTVFQHILNRSFSCINVQKYSDSNEVIVQNGDVETESLEKYANYPAIAYETVLEYLTSYYPNMDTANVIAEIFYSATVQPGYFSPVIGSISKTGLQPKAVKIFIQWLMFY